MKLKRATSSLLQKVFSSWLQLRWRDGSGIARQIRNKCPDVYSIYSHNHNYAGLHLGDVIFVGGSSISTDGGIDGQLHGISNQLPLDLIAANAMTQYRYGRDPNTVYVDYDAVAACFARINMLSRNGFTVNFPLIGCGLANGDLEDVAQAIESVMPSDAKLILWKFSD